MISTTNRRGALVFAFFFFFFFFFAFFYLVSFGQFLCIVVSSPSVQAARVLAPTKGEPNVVFRCESNLHSTHYYSLVHQRIAQTDRPIERGRNRPTTGTKRCDVDARRIEPVAASIATPPSSPQIRARHQTAFRTPPLHLTWIARRCLFVV
jgi:hypothetical protein